MAPSATLPPASPVTKTVPVSDIKSLKVANDWQADLERDGYAIVKGAIPHDRAVGYQQKAFEWLKSFDNPELDLANPQTWIKANLPVQSHINTFNTYRVAHERFMWEARMEPGVIAAFAAIWGTRDLLVSFDSLNITFPNRTDVPRKQPWEHVDQSPLRRGKCCVQGIINLSSSGPEDGGLLVYPGSHKLVEGFFDAHTDHDSWVRNDFYHFDAEQLAWFTAQGIKPIKVCAEPGDLILWDSRTIHYGAEPTERGTTIRTAIYAAYTPASWATEDALAKKQSCFAVWGTTTHWPHENIRQREEGTFLEDGTRDPRDREEPREKPVLSGELLRLAGVEKY